MIFITPGSRYNPLYMDSGHLKTLEFMLDGMEEKLKQLEGARRDAFVLACRRWLHSGWPDVFPEVFITAVGEATEPRISAEDREKVINEIFESTK